MKHCNDKVFLFMIILQLVGAFHNTIVYKQIRTDPFVCASVFTNLHSLSLQICDGCL